MMNQLIVVMYRETLEMIIMMMIVKIVPNACDIVMRSQENIQCMMKTDLFELEFQPEALQASALSMYH